jgi:hypothetical protein
MSKFANRYLEITHTEGVSYIYLTPLINPPEPVLDPIITEDDPHEISIIKCPFKSHIPYNAYTIEGGFLSEEYENYALPIINMKLENPHYQQAKYVTSTSNNITSFQDITVVKIIYKTYYYNN